MVHKYINIRVRGHRLCFSRFCLNDQDEGKTVFVRNDIQKKGSQGSTKRQMGPEVKFKQQADSDNITAVEAQPELCSC